MTEYDVMAGYRQEAELYKALAHPVRLVILDLLSRQEACVCHLTAVLGQRQPYVSQQLAILRRAGLVASRQEGNLVFYRLPDQRLVALLAIGRQLLPLAAGSTTAGPALPVGAVSGCPCPRCREAVGRPMAAVGSGP